MKTGRFGFGSASKKAGQGNTSHNKKHAKDVLAISLLEPLESRMLLSSTALLASTPATLTSTQIVSPAVATGAITLVTVFPNTSPPISAPISAGENSPTIGNSTDFGGTAPNSPISVTYTIQNNASGTLSLTGATPVTISGLGASLFKVTTQPGASVASGSSTTFTITFTPTSVGNQNATVSIASNDPAGAFTFAVRGTGTTTGEVTVTGNGTYIVAGEGVATGQGSPTIPNFTDFSGTSDSLSPNGAISLTRTFVITNPLNAGVLSLLGGATPVTISGTGASAFTVTTQPGVSTIAAGQTASFTITFTPSTAGLFSAQVHIASSDPNGSFTFTIQGTGLTMTAVGTVQVGGLQMFTSTPGGGAGAANNEILIMTYAGYLTDGTLFDSSALPSHTVPYFEFDLGVGQVIQGWDKSILGMKIGQTMEVIIPPDLGYGSQSPSPLIPANSTLIFDIKLLGMVNIQAQVGGSNVAVTDGEANPSTTNGTLFDSSNLTTTFVINSPSASLKELYGISSTDSNGVVSFSPPVVVVHGASSFTVSQVTLNPQDTQATFTVTYTPTTGLSTAVVTLVSNNAANPNYTFAVQAQGPAPDDGAVTFAASTYSITGFAFDPTNLTSPDTVTITITGGSPSQVFTQTLNANLPSPELQNEFGNQNHDYKYALPVLSVGTHTVTVTATNSTTNNVTVLGTTTVTSQNSLFDEHYYLMQNPDVAAAVASGAIASGYEHYIQFGQFENRSPSPYWDEAYYLQMNPDVAAEVKAGTVSSGFMQFYNTGQFQNRPGLVYFNQTYYLNKYGDVAGVVNGTFSAFEHYVLYGQYEGRSPMLYFDQAVYLSHNHDVQVVVTNNTLFETIPSVFEQYVLYGQFDGGGSRIASNFYNNHTYLTDNPDVAAAVAAGTFPDGLQHWLKYGQFEGRTAV